MLGYAESRAIQRMCHFADQSHGCITGQTGIGIERNHVTHVGRYVRRRLDADVLAAYLKIGDVWQARINADLRKARKLKAG